MSNATDPNVAQMMQMMQRLAHSLQNMVREMSSTAAGVNTNRRQLNDEMGDYTDNLSSANRHMREAERLAENARRAREREIAAYDDLTAASRELEQALEQYGDGSEQARTAQARVTETTNRHRTAVDSNVRAQARHLNATNSLIKGINISNASLVWFGATMKTQARQLQAQMKATGGVTENGSNLLYELFNQQFAGFKLGLSGSEFKRLVSNIGQTSNAMGGMQNTVDTASASINRLRVATGDSAEAVKVALEGMQNLAQLGIKPTSAQLQLYTTDLIKMTAATGMSADAAASFYGEIANDSASIDLLRKSREGERESIIANQRALVQNSLALGMTAAQAKEAAKTLNRITAAKPLDRIKQAAKLRALGGAMGIGGTEEAARDLMMGKKNSQALMSVMEKIANKRDELSQEGKLPTEIMVSELVSKLGFDDLLGANSPFSTTLAGPLKSQLVKTDETNSHLGNIYNQLKKLTDQFGLLASGDFFAGAIAAGLAALFARPLFQGLFKGLMNGAQAAAPAAAGAARGAGGAIAENADAAAGAARGADAAADAARGVGGAEAGAAAAGSGATNGLLSKALKIFGGAAAVGVGAYEGYDNYKKTDKLGESVGLGAGNAAGGLAGGWAGATAGAAIGAAGGPLGILIGGLIGGAFGGWGGSEIGGMGGKALGGMLDAKKPNEQPVEPAKAPNSSSGKIGAPPTTQDQQQGKLKNPAEKTDATLSEILNVNKSVADATTISGRKQDISNTLLQQMMETMQRQTEISEKQLVALTMTEQQRTSKDIARALRKDVKFATSYGYV